MKRRYDSLGRRSPQQPQSSGKRITATTHDLNLFERLLWHGPLPTPYLLAFSTQFGHQSIGRARDRLTDLFHEENTPHGGRYLDRPKAQFPKLPGGFIPRNHTMVYEPTRHSLAALREAGRFVHTKHDGWWEHQLTLACVTASIDLATLAQREVSFIPRHEAIGSRALATTVPIVNNGRTYSGKLCPDSLFGIRYGADKYLYCAVEVDRSTEMIADPSFKRKSFLRSLLQYRQLIGTNLYQQAYGLQGGLIVLMLTTSERQLDRMLALTGEISQGRGNTFMFFKCLPDISQLIATPHPSLLEAAWLRAGKPSVRLLQLK